MIRDYVRLARVGRGINQMTFFRKQTSKDGKKFYRNLLNGACKNYIWGKNKRFNPIRVFNSPSINKYFTLKVEKHISSNHKVLDLGCGNGVFLAILASRCEKTVGIDISVDMLNDCSKTIERLGIANVKLINATSEKIPFPDNEFDVICLVDVIHHVEQLQESVLETHRVLKPGGKLLVFEPNKYNPVLALLCFLDRNEWGALRLGSMKRYRQLFEPYFNIYSMEYNGLLIGPDSKINCKIADFLNLPIVRNLLGWLNPKIFISMTKKSEALVLEP